MIYLVLGKSLSCCKPTPAVSQNRALKNVHKTTFFLLYFQLGN